MWHVRDRQVARRTPAVSCPFTRLWGQDTARDTSLFLPPLTSGPSPPPPSPSLLSCPLASPPSLLSPPRSSSPLHSSCFGSPVTWCCHFPKVREAALWIWPCAFFHSAVLMTVARSQSLGAEEKVDVAPKFCPGEQLRWRESPVLILGPLHVLSPGCLRRTPMQSKAGGPWEADREPHVASAPPAGTWGQVFFKAASLPVWLWAGSLVQVLCWIQPKPTGVNPLPRDHLVGWAGSPFSCHPSSHPLP